MAFRNFSTDVSSNYTPQYAPPHQVVREQTPRQPYQLPQERQEGALVASVGRRDKTLSVESIYRIDVDLLGYNLFGGKVLLRVPQNDLSFDSFIALPFTKGVTERETGRTMLILGSNAHHVEAMGNQFEGVLWTKADGEEIKKFGDTIRWINVGDTKNGFIGVDYNSSAQIDAGVARTSADIQFLSQTLLSHGYDSQKRLFLLKPPYIQERPEGKALRKEGLEHLTEIAKADTTRLAKLLRDRAFDIEVEDVRV